MALTAHDPPPPPVSAPPYSFLHLPVNDILMVQEQGVDCYMKDGMGRTPCWYAQYSRQSATVEWFKANEAKKDAGKGAGEGGEE